MVKYILDQEEQWEKKLQKAIKKENRILKSARIKGKKEAEKILEEARKKSEQIIQESRKKSEEETEQLNKKFESSIEFIKRKEKKIPDLANKFLARIK